MYWIEVRLLQRNACAARSSTCIAGEHGRIWMTVHRYVQLWRDLHLQEHDNLALKRTQWKSGTAISNVIRSRTQISTTPGTGETLNTLRLGPVSPHQSVHKGKK